MKRLLLMVLACMAFSIASHAQTQTTDLQVGDSVWVNPDTTHYMTGEKISSWVYTVKHAIEQIESVFHPNGVLLTGIKSWVHRNAILSDKHAATDTPAQAVEPAPVADNIVEERPTLSDVIATEEERAEVPVIEEPTTTTQATNLPTRLIGRVVSSDNHAIANATITLANQGIKGH